ncbi:RNA-directed DNA polymerase from mobile element jockey [Trichonephila clavipes]|nr:RNA-directed DNA polymerase from mobile element jockey [Trichonephila clavipes]
MQDISITWKRRVINMFYLYHPPNQGHLPAEIVDCSDKNTIFLGDLNAKHQSWGCSTNNDRGNDLLNADDDRALIFLNSGLPTHTSFSYGTSEVLDITLVLALNSIHIVIGTSLAALAVTTSSYPH